MDYTVTDAPASRATKVVGPDRYRPPRHRMPCDSRHHVTQPTCLGHADAPGAGGGGLHQHHTCIGVPRTCARILRGRDEYSRMAPRGIVNKTNIDLGAL